MMNPGVQMSKMQQIANDLPLFWKKEPTVQYRRRIKVLITSESAMILERLSRNLKIANAMGQNNYLHGFLR